MTTKFFRRNISASLVSQIFISLIVTGIEFAIEPRVGDIVSSGTEEITPIDDVCFEVEGCFPMGKPWRYVRRPLPAPASPCDIGTRVILATRFHSKGSAIQISPNIQLSFSFSKNSQPIYIITHGIGGSIKQPWVTNLKSALLSKVDSHVFLVDWSRGANESINYLQVASNTRVVGSQVGRLLEHLVKEHNVNPASIHLIGFCLGAHVLAYAAKRIKDVGRLTALKMCSSRGSACVALDPTAAGFAGPEPRVRVDADDALLVEIIHTDARPAAAALLPGIGMRAEYGDVDFYINGGVNQPDCEPSQSIPNITSLASLENVMAGQLYNASKCSHERAVNLYVEAIKSSKCTFWGHPGTLVTSPAIEYCNIDQVADLPSPQYLVPSSESCNLINCAPMGFESSKFPGRGAYYILTNPKSPYCVLEPEVDNFMRKTLSATYKLMNKVSVARQGVENSTCIKTPQC